MELIMLGTGHAGVTESYNTCFLLHENNQYFLTDTGGGNGILRQLKRAGVSPRDIHDVFITHRHTDHMLGMLWLVRMARGSLLRIYGHDAVIHILSEMIVMLYPDTGLENIELIPVQDGESRTVIDHEIMFFDIHSRKAKQFGYKMEIGGGQTLTCLGDEPYSPLCYPYVHGSTWLMHEAFCLEAESDKYNPHRIAHSTVKDACENAAMLEVKHLILYHMEEKTGADRKRLYMEEGRQYCSCPLFVPDDMERLKL